MSEVVGWIITEDHLWEEGDDKRLGTKPRTGKIFVTSGTEEEVRKLVSNPKTRQHFKTYDDDENINYEGFATPDTEFEPLDWAMADVGSTEIQYHDPKTGKYEIL